MNAGGDVEEDVTGISSVVLVLKTFWGIAAVLGLASYSLLLSVNDDDTAAGAGEGARRPEAIPSPAFVKSGPIVIGNVTMYPFTATEPPVVVHLACDAEEARLARMYDAPPPGRSVILRIDQSLERMRRIYQGGDPQFPPDARIVTTPCIQGMIDRGEFP